MEETQVEQQDKTSADQTDPTEPVSALRRNRYADTMNKKKKGKGIVKKIIGGVLVLALIGGGIYWWKSQQTQASDTPDTQLAVVTRGMLETYVEGSGLSAAKKREELGKELKGKVVRVLAQIGDTMKVGDPIIEIDPVEKKNELEAARKELAEAQRSVTEAQSGVVKAQGEVTAAQGRIARLAVRAPFSGKLIPVTDDKGATTSYRVGQQLGEGEIIGYMVDDSVLTLSLYYSTAYLDTIAEGQQANISIPAAMSTVTGEVQSVEKVIKISQDGVQTFRVNLTLPNPGTLTQGMVATASLMTDMGEVFPIESSTLRYLREEAVSVQSGGEIVKLGGIDYYSYQAGEVILQLASETLQEALQTAQNGVATAQTGVTNAQELAADKQKRVSELEAEVQKTKLTSTIEGVLVSLDVAEGQELGGGNPIAVVANMSDVVVNADVPGTDVGTVQAGQAVTMTMYNNDGELSMTGTVQSVALEPTQNSGGGQGSLPTFRAVISIDPIEGQNIPIGMSVDYRITTASSIDCLSVPNGAVVNTEQGTAVFVQGEDFPNQLPIPEGTEVPEGFTLVPVEVGISDAKNTEILSGVEEGATVYLSITDVFDGMDWYGEMAYG